MPRYFFDTDDGEKRHDDDEGTELADDQAARDEAVQAMAEIASDYLPGTAGPQKNITMWIRNEADDTILQLALAFTIHRPRR